MAKLVDSTHNWSFVQELPSVPASFPDISNEQLQAWCRECNSILKAQRIIELRRCVSGAAAAAVG